MGEETAKDRLGPVATGRQALIVLDKQDLAGTRRLCLLTCADRIVRGGWGRTCRSSFASVLSLAYRRFSTGIPEPLLAVSELKGGGRSKEMGTIHRRSRVATMVPAVVDPVVEATDEK